MKNTMITRLTKNKAVKERVLNEDVGEQDFVSTGCLSLNILFSGRLQGGIPVGKINEMAAPSSLGKTFVGLKVAKNALKKEDWIVIYIDTEYAFDFEFAKSIGIDLDRMIVIQGNRLEEIQEQVMSIETEFTREEREKILLVIDSWGGIVSSKTVENATIGKDVKDLTITQKKNTFAKLLTGIGITGFIINHIYHSFNQYDPLEIPGGEGLRYASSSIVLASSKSKAKETASSKEVIGASILAITKKSRFCKELTKLRYLIRYSGGIDPYFGIMDDALEGGYITKPKMGWYSRPNVENDKNWREKEINDNGAEFWGSILKDTDFTWYIEKKYTFLHSEIVDEDFDF